MSIISVRVFLVCPAKSARCILDSSHFLADYCSGFALKVHAKYRRLAWEVIKYYELNFCFDPDWGAEHKARGAY